MSISNETLCEFFVLFIQATKIAINTEVNDNNHH